MPLYAVVKMLIYISRLPLTAKKIQSEFLPT